MLKTRRNEKELKNLFLFNSQAASEAVNLYDAVRLYAVAYNRTVKNCTKKNPTDTRACVNNIKNLMGNIFDKKFEGMGIF